MQSVGLMVRALPHLSSIVIFEASGMRVILMNIRPQPGPQELFLSTPADIAIYGGAAGGGKSYALLLEGARHKKNPKFGGMIFRHNANQIFAEGSLWDTSMALYPLLGGKPRKSPKPQFVFKSGAKITFAHIERDEDVHGYQGSQIAFIGFDELTHFTKFQFFYMLSRNRSTCGVKPYMRATCNPDVDSWVADFIKWYIDQDTGYPIEERSGVIRWFIRRNDEIFWADSEQELIDRFELRTPEELAEPRSFTFIAAKLSDNKILMELNPQYLSNLKALPQVERERLLYGNWKIKPAAGMYFKRAHVQLLEEVPDDVVRWVRAWDFAATEDRKENNPEDGPAYTAGVLIGKRRCGRWVIADVVNQRLSAAQVKATVYNTAVADKVKYKHVRIRLSQDPGQAGKDQAEQYVKHLAGFSVAVVRETGSKETRAEPLSAQWEARPGYEHGNVDVVIGPWNEAFFAQLESFPQGKFKDMVDASANGFNELESKNRQIPLDQSAAQQTHESKWSV